MSTDLIKDGVCLICGIDESLLADERDALRARAAALTEALKKYGHHLNVCPAGAIGIPKTCYCGLDAAREG